MSNPHNPSSILNSLLDKASEVMDLVDGGSDSDSQEEVTPVEVPHSRRPSTCLKPLKSGRLCQLPSEHAESVPCFHEDDELGPLQDELEAERRVSDDYRESLLDDIDEELSAFVLRIRAILKKMKR